MNVVDNPHMKSLHTYKLCYTRNTYLASFYARTGKTPLITRLQRYKHKNFYMTHGFKVFLVRVAGGRTRTMYMCVLFIFCNDPTIENFPM